MKNLDTLNKKKEVNYEQLDLETERKKERKKESMTCDQIVAVT
jgi:hypothetical protein